MDLPSTLYYRCSDTIYYILEQLALEDLLHLSGTNKLFRDLVFRAKYRNIWLSRWKQEVSEINIPDSTIRMIRDFKLVRFCLTIDHTESFLNSINCSDSNQRRLLNALDELFRFGYEKPIQQLLDEIHSEKNLNNFMSRSIKYSQVHIVELLLTRGARLEPHWYLIHSSSPDMVKLLSQHGLPTTQTEVKNAVKAERPDIIQYYAEKNSTYGPYALGYALDNCLFKVAASLLAMGISLPNNYMRSCSIGEDREIIWFLVTHGIPIEQETFHQACECNDFEMVKLFLQHGATIDAKSFNQACYHGNLEMVTLFIQHGFRIDQIEPETIGMMQRHQDIELIEYLTGIGLIF
jgi:Ankyrin repeats (many copies)